MEIILLNKKEKNKMNITHDLLRDMGFKARDNGGALVFENEFIMNIMNNTHQIHIVYNEPNNRYYFNMYGFRKPTILIENVEDLISQICYYFIIAGKEQKANEIKQVLNI